MVTTPEQSLIAKFAPSLRGRRIEAVKDMAGKEIVPYLIQFSKVGIVPNIIGVKTSANSKTAEVRMVRVQGPRLDYLLENEGNEDLVRIYQKLGTHVGYMSKYDIAHNDLHTENIVVEKQKPFVIDWDEAMMGITSCDDLRLLVDTELVLKSDNRFYLYRDLERAFRTAYNEEGSSPINVTHAEIRDAAFKEFGLILTP